MKKTFINDQFIINTKIANNMFIRMKGLMGTKNINYGILLSPCNSIHTFFMKDSIDVVYLDKNSVIISIDECVVPWKICRVVKKAKYVLELPKNSIKKYNIRLNDTVLFQ